VKLNVSVSRLDEGLGALTVLEILCVRRMGKFAACVARRICPRSLPQTHASQPTLPSSRASAGSGFRGDQGCGHSVHLRDRAPDAWKGNGRTRSCPTDEYADGSCPGVIAAYGGSAEEMARRRDEQCPMGRMGDAWDVAYAFNAVPTPF
jgi:hypothetical protein